MEVFVNEPAFEKRLSHLRKRYEAVREKQGNAYLILRKTVAERFLEYAAEDMQSGMFERAVYVMECVGRLIDEIESGELGDFEVNAYKTHRPHINGYSMEDDSGRPFFYCGYGHFGQIKRDVTALNAFGCNTIQIEIGPNSILYPAGTHEKWGMTEEELFGSGERYIYTDGEFEVNLAPIKKDIIPVLEKAEKCNVGVCLLLSPHYFPMWLYDKYPELRSKNQGFIKYNIYHPKAAEMLRVFYKAVLPLVKDFKSLHSICISNEPVFNTALDKEQNSAHEHELLPTLYGNGCFNTRDIWCRHLSEKYKSIDNLNEKWKTDYSDFSDIDMPDDDDASVRFYEWHLWNNAMFADWHRSIAGMIREYAPGIPLQSKFMPIFGVSDTMPYHRRFVKYGIDPELFAEFTDISGNDAWSFEGREHLPLSLKLQWYDYLASIKKMPVQDSEDHVIEDRNNDYSPVQAQRIYADMWQGAVHGRTASDIWVWERTNMPQATANGSILHRPDCVEAVGRACLDLNRLGDKVTALQNKEYDAVILFSKAARVYDSDFTAELFKAYEGGLFSRAKTGFVTEGTVKELSADKLLILPYAEHIEEAVFESIESFIKRGGRAAVILNGGSFAAYDEYGNKRSGSLVKGVTDSAVIIDIRNAAEHDDAARTVTAVLNSICGCGFAVTDTDGDTYGIEVNYAVCGGKTVVNICSHGSKKGEIKAVTDFGGGKFTNLITGEEYTDGIVMLKPYTPVMIEFE